MTDQEVLTFDPDTIPCEETSDPAVLSKTPLVSVMMITYNHEPHIAQAIEGVLAQETEVPIELVIGEDCSTDRTRDIVMEYQKKHPAIIRVITSEENVGMTKNACRTEKACRGKYIAYCEGDDFWVHPKKLRMQVDYLEAHPECGLVHGDFELLHQQRGTLQHSLHKSYGFDLQNSPDPFRDILLERYPVATCTVCVRRSLLEEAKNRERLLLTNLEIKQGDLPRWLYISNISDVHCFTEVFGTYRILSESAAHSQSTADNLAFLESSRRVRMYFAQKYGCAAEVRSIVEERYFGCLLDIAYHNGDAFAARHAYHKLRELGHRMSILQWACFFGACFTLFRIVAIPLLVLHRMRQRLYERRRLRKSAVRSAGSADRSRNAA